MPAPPTHLEVVWASAEVPMRPLDAESTNKIRLGGPKHSYTLPSLRAYVIYVVMGARREGFAYISQVGRLEKARPALEN